MNVDVVNALRSDDLVSLGGASSAVAGDHVLPMVPVALLALLLTLASAPPVMVMNHRHRLGIVLHKRGKRGGGLSKLPPGTNLPP